MKFQMPPVNIAKPCKRSVSQERPMGKLPQGTLAQHGNQRRSASRHTNSRSCTILMCSRSIPIYWWLEAKLCTDKVLDSDQRRRRALVLALIWAGHTRWTSHIVTANKLSGSPEGAAGDSGGRGSLGLTPGETTHHCAESPESDLGETGSSSSPTGLIMSTMCQSK